MHYTVHGAPLYCYSAGKAFQPEQPTLVFIHGVLNDHSVWILQSRYFAHHGYNVLAIDLPGHGRSGGAACTRVEQAADAVLALLDAVGAPQATLVGHSLGSLIALEAAARAPERVEKLVLVGTAYPMKVSEALLSASQEQPMKALAMVNTFSRATLAAPPSALGPGTWVFGAGMALGRRILASNREVNLFYTGFKACDSYSGGEAAMAQVRCPVLFALGRNDQMPPPKAAQGLIALCAQPTVVHLPGGHNQMSETPEELLAAMKAFLRK